MLKPLVAAVTISALFPLLSESVVAQHAKKDDARVLVAKWMKHAHSGDKSALKRMDRMLKEGNPRWEDVKATLTDLQGMAEVLKKGKGFSHYTTPAGYIDGVSTLAAAAARNDLEAARSAIAKVHQSCNACHYGVPR